MAKSVFSNWAGLFVNGIVSLLLTPLLLHAMGPVYFGMWVLTASLLDYYGLIDVGIRTALFRFVARYKGAGHQDAMHEAVVTALCAAGVVSLMLLVVAPLVVLVLPDFFHVEGSARRTFQIVLMLAAGSMAVTIPARVLGSVLTGTGRFDLFNLASAATTLIRAAAIVVAVKAGHGIVAINLVSFGAAVLSLAIFRALVRRADPDLRLHGKHLSIGRLRELYDFGWAAFVNVTGEQLRSYTDSMVIARVLALSLVAPFNIATRFLENFKVILSAAGGPLLGMMSELDGQDRQRDLARVFLSGTRYMALLALFLGSLIFWNAGNAVSLWVGDAFLESASIVTILLCAYVPVLAQYPSQLALFARAEHKPLAWLTLTEGGANLLLSVYWARDFGLTGVALGTAVPMIVCQMWQPVMALRSLRLGARSYLLQALARPLLVAVLFNAVLMVAPSSVCTWPSFCLGVMWQTALYAVLTWWLGLFSFERRSLWQRRSLTIALSAARAK